MPTLADFQAQFASALLQPVAVANRDAALAVYRNTVMKGLVDALAANFPSVQRLVGEAWFAGAASCFARACPPNNPVLAWYGAGFAEFLDQFPPARELPYLAEVARLDRCWNEAYFAADAPALTAVELQALDQPQLFAATLTLHPATHLGVFKHSALSIWLANHPSMANDASPGALEISDEAEAALFTRPHAAVETLRLNASEYSFLAKLQTAASLGEAAMTMLERDPQFPLAQALARFIKVGAFTSICSCNTPAEQHQTSDNNS